MTKNITPLVSVCMTTYNHEKYIGKAIESVLAQEVDFPIEIVIGEDNSTDATREIVLEFEKKYPQTIKVVLSPTNLGMNGNLIKTLTQCQGRYIAWLDGDDFWTSTHKLKKQVVFLENNPECTICFHKAEVLIQENGQIRGLWPDFDPPTITTINDILQNNYIPTSSVMYRNVNIETIPKGFYKLGISDWPLHIMYAQKGNIGFLNETMAQYRIHSTSMFSTLKGMQKIATVFKALEFTYPLVAKEHKEKLGLVIIEYCYQLAQMSLENKDSTKARGYLAKGISYFAYFWFYKGRNSYLKLLLRVFFPRLYTILAKAKRTL